MYLTERTAIKHRLESIRREKEALRDEISILRDEERTYIQRLGELDEKQADVLDAEAIIERLADTAKELKALIPEVPTVDVIKRMEEKLDPAKIINNDEEETNEAHEQLAEEGKEQRYKEAPVQVPATKPKQKRGPNLSADEFVQYMKEGAKEMEEFKINQVRNLAIDRGMPYMDSAQFGSRLHYAKKQLGLAFPFEKKERGVYRWKEAFKKDNEERANDDETREVALV